MIYTATYSPEDNKLRLSASQRLDKDEYQRVKAAGFIWAAKQGVFVAPAWTPSRADLLIELAGEIGDEDTSLVDRAEQRADRFEGYEENRTKDAEQAHKAVHAIADNIPLGQPILVGHHSEKHARKDAERIENGMRKAIRMWDTAAYWRSRAAGAIAHAKYKERPDVRARRIKGLESDERKMVKNISEAEAHSKLWSADGLTKELALFLANYSHLSLKFTLAEYPRDPPISQYEGDMGIWSALDHGIITAEQARDISIPAYQRGIAYNTRWLEHTRNRLEYERAMLAEAGGMVSDKFDIQVGGQIKRRGEWLLVKAVNRKDGKINSVSVFGHFAATVTADEIFDYKPPAEGDAEKVRAAVKAPPLCNFKSEGCIEMTTAEWKGKTKFTDSYAVRGFTASGNYRWRSEGEDKIVYRHRSYYRMGNQTVTPVFLTDSKVSEAPGRPAPKPPVDLPKVERTAREPRPVVERPVNPADKLREALKAGVKVTVAPQLFPTPAELAARMADMADVYAGDRVLEPSAGTGRLLDPLPLGAVIVAVECNVSLAQSLAAKYSWVDVRTANFLTCNGDLGKFDRIIMNPPFVNGEDIKHILHARTFLTEKGKIVALCANGPRQQEKLKPLAATWEVLPAGTFESEGTGVNVALLTMEAA